MSEQRSDKKVLRDLRKKLDITREDLVRKADVSLGTIRNAECGKTVNERSATRILAGLNDWLKTKHQPEVSLDEISIIWK